MTAGGQSRALWNKQRKRHQGVCTAYKVQKLCDQHTPWPRWRCCRALRWMCFATSLLAPPPKSNIVQGQVWEEAGLKRLGEQAGRWLVFTVKLNGFRITMEIHLRVRLWACFQKGLTEEGRASLIWAPRPLGPQTAWWTDCILKLWAEIRLLLCKSLLLAILSQQPPK